MNGILFIFLSFFEFVFCGCRGIFVLFYLLIKFLEEEYLYSYICTDFFMSRRLIELMCMVFVVIVCISLVAAAGGGGGGSGGSGGGSSSSSSSSGSSGGSGTFLYALKCDSTGQLQFFQKPMTNPVQVLSKKSGKMMDVPGTWAGTTFTSEEAVLVEAGEYDVIDLINGNKTVSCPGLDFSCKLVGLDVQKCVKKGKKLEVYFTVDKVSIDDLQFEFVTVAKTSLKYSKNAFSSELKELQMRTLTPVGRYVLEVDGVNSEITQVQISHPDCIGKYYVYSKGKCVDEQEVVLEKEKKGKELKCGGYLGIEDRVTCRLKLTEDERKEYQNFYPEECMVRKDKEKCLNVYEAVQPCWQKENGKERIQCVKDAVNVGDVSEERAKCATLSKEMQDDCLLRLQEKVYGVVKFRLYNLEEEAEGLLEKGYLGFDDVRNFVVKMELKKSAFNIAQTKEQRVKVLLAAREDWKELTGKVKQ